MKKMLLTIFIIGAIIYVSVCLLMYFKQERFIFFPQKLAQNFKFNYSKATEVYLAIEDNKHIHGLYFSDTPNPVGVILYFHGNAGALDKWGVIAEDFLPLSYDVLVMDYRTYGKSQGNMSEQNLFDDAQLAYDYLSDKFDAKEIVIYGRSIGTGIASNLASKNLCRVLILETPYFNLYDVVKNHFKLIPKKNLLEYNFRNDIHIQTVNSPVYIFHGTNDKVIPLTSALKLKPLIDDDCFTIIEDANHHNIGKFPIYQEKLKKILE